MNFKFGRYYVRQWINIGSHGIIGQTGLIGISGIPGISGITGIIKKKFKFGR